MNSYFRYLGVSMHNESKATRIRKISHFNSLTITVGLPGSYWQESLVLASISLIISPLLRSHNYIVRLLPLIHHNIRIIYH